MKRTMKHSESVLVAQKRHREATILMGSHITDAFYSWKDMPKSELMTEGIKLFVSGNGITQKMLLESYIRTKYVMSVNSYEDNLKQEFLDDSVYAYQVYFVINDMEVYNKFWEKKKRQSMDQDKSNYKRMVYSFDVDNF